MIIGIPAEIHSAEKRVAASPEMVEKLIKAGFEVRIEAGAGDGASFTDEVFASSGAKIVDDTASVWGESDLVIKVRPPEQNEQLGQHEIDLLKEGAHLISFVWPAQNEDLLQRLTKKNATALAMDSIPRISRAQKLDALSSMANIGGYRAVVEASNLFGRFFSGQITAAGKVPPAKVLVIGAGVAGLAAIGTAKSLGAIVRAFDTRPEVKDQIQSMDAEFLELDFEEDGTGEGGYAKVMSEEFIKAEMALFAEQAKDVDIIITTALIPGKPAPKLITAETARSMKDGSVIVDLAAEQGGNCELTVANDVIVDSGVTVIGYTDLPSRLAAQSSQLYATNLRHLLTDLTPEKDGNIVVDMEDEVIRGTTICKDGETTWPPPAPKISAAPPAPKAEPAPVAPAEDEKPSVMGPIIGMIVGGLALLGLGAVAPPSFMAHFTVFVLACFVGYMVIWNVTPALHTPLMSVTNAISSIIIIDALLQISSADKVIMWIAIATVAVTAVNIAGGFAVTRRMLEMFRK